MAVPIDETDSVPAVPEKVVSLKRFEGDSEELVYDLDRKAYTSQSKKVI